MMKRKFGFIAVVLTLCLLLGQLSPIVVRANEKEPTITVLSVQKYAGEMVDVTLTMENNPGIANVMLTVEFDSSVMTLTKVTDGGILGTTNHNPSLKSPYYLNWMNDTVTSNFTQNGVLATLTFTISEDIEEQKVSNITVSYDNVNNTDIYDVDFNLIDFKIVNGSATIKVPEKPVEGVSLDKTSLDMTAGDTATLTPSFTPSNATNKNVTWKSSDEEVATVKDGVVTAVAKGNATITVTTEDGAKTATCAVSVACAHTEKTPYTKVEPTCISKGHEAYVICNQCKEVIDGEDKEIDMLPHTLTKHNPVEPTHTTAGNIQYWDCSECEQYFSDEGETVISKESVLLAADKDAHDYTGTWNKDDKSHWKDCGCGIQVSIGEHEYDNTCDTTCDTCGHTRTITHTWEKAYSYDANGHWIQCSVCKVKQAEPESHKGGTATCQEKAKCEVCKQAYGSTVEHDFTAQKEETKYLQNKATCMAEAVYYKSCTMCGEKGTETFVGSTKDANNHTGNNTVKDAVTATCYQEGYTGDTYCECGAKVATGSTIKKTAHTPSTTYEKDGANHWKVCTVAECGARLDEKAHGYDNVCDATCDTCGYTRTVTHPFDTSKWVTDGRNHWHACSTAGCTEKTDVETHKGGTATCQEKAKCSVCNKAYGSTVEHDLTAEKEEEKYLKTKATCMAEAVYYKSCTMCGEKGTETFVGSTKDANNHTGNNTVKDVVTATCYQEGYTGDTYCECGAKVATGSTVKKTAHTPSTTYQKDGTNHWKVCTVVECGAKIDVKAHGYDNVCDADCNTCGHTRTVTHPFDTSKWVTDGTNHWHACTTSGCTEKTDVEAHKGGTATCQDKAKCEVCNKAYGTTIDHAYTAEVVDAKYLKTEATCKDVAVYYKSCTMCGAKGTETFNGEKLDADNHVGGTELKAVKEATCTEEGYTGDTHCKGCDAKLESGKKVNKLPHDVRGWEVSKEATVDAEGEKTGTCTGCSQPFTVKTAKLVAELKEDKVEGNLKAEVKTEENTTLPGDSIFVAEDVTENIEKEEEKKVETAVEKAVEKVEAVTEKHEVASILDLKIIVREFATNGEAIKEKEHEPEGKVTVTVAIPDVVLELFENIILLHVKDDGTVEQVPFSYVNGDKAKFTTDGFSYYVFVGTEKVVENPTQQPTTPAKPSSPQTGDHNTITWAIIMLVACASVVTVVNKKRRYN